MPNSQYYKQFLIYEWKYWSIYLYVDKSFTCYLGRIYIWSRRDEDSGEFVSMDIDDMSDEEITEFYELRALSKRVLNKLFQPDLFNWAELMNLASHPHGHLIPRYLGTRRFNGETWVDKRWGKNAWPYKIEREAGEEEKFALLEVIKDAFVQETAS